MFSSNLIGEFTFKAVETICDQCTKRKLALDCTACETFEGGTDYIHRLYCENAEQCAYAYNRGKVENGDF